MTNPIGVNFDITRIQNKDVFPARMRALDPALFVPRIENFNDAGLIEALAAQFPNAIIHARVMESKEEGGYHLRPKGLNDNRPMVATPEDIINKYARLGKRNMSLYLLNEPNDKPPDEENPDAVERLNQWVVNACEHATATQTHITILNWGVQMPYPDGRFDDALRAMSQHRAYVTLGVHEYLPRRDVHGNLRVPYFVNILSRYRDVLKLPAPAIANTEFGYDGADGSGLSDFASRGISDAQAARDFIDVIDNDYRPYIDGGSLQGAALFSYTRWGDKDTEGFGLEGRDSFWEVLLGWRYVPGSAPIATPPKEPTKPLPQFVPKPSNMSIPTRVKALKGRNIRGGPDTTYANGASDNPDISAGDELTYYAVPAVKDSFQPTPRYWHWCEVHTGKSAGEAGWICLTGFQFESVKSSTGEIPVVKPEIPVELLTENNPEEVKEYKFIVTIKSNEPTAAEIAASTFALLQAASRWGKAWETIDIRIEDLSPQEGQKP